MSGARSIAPDVGTAPKRIGLAADHGGFALKETIAEFLEQAGFTVIDFGATSLTLDDDYPDFVFPMAKAVIDGEIDRGIAICGSGVGASVAANKVPGIRAALIHDNYSAHQGVEDDALNVLCLGGRVIGPSLACELVKTFLDARFSGAERHCRRLKAVAYYEDARRTRAD